MAPHSQGTRMPGREASILSAASGVELLAGSVPSLVATGPGALSGSGEAIVSVWPRPREGTRINLLFSGLCPLLACEYRRRPQRALPEPVGSVCRVPNSALPFLSCAACTSVPPSVERMISLDAHDVLCAASGTQEALGPVTAPVIDLITSVDTNAFEVDI